MSSKVLMFFHRKMATIATVQLPTKPPSVRSVSYTHLDVYKRQSIARAEDILNMLIAVYNEDVINDKNKIDVYKRQVQGCTFLLYKSVQYYKH